MRALALVLIIAVPAMSFAQQKVELTSPSFEQPVSQKLLTPEATPTPLVQRWYFWTIVGVSLAAVAGALAFAAWSISRPTTPVTLSQRDFGCNPMCAGWLNKPAP